MANKIPVLGVPFTVTYPNKVDSKDNNLGETDGPMRTIKVKKNLTNDIKHETLLHELIHAILYVSGHSELISEETEESIVIAIESGLSQVVRIKEEYFGSKS